MCEKRFKHFSVHFQASSRQAYNPLIMPLKQSPFTVICSTCYRGVFSELTEHIPNVSHTPGMYLLDTDLAGTHTALQECLSALFAG